MIDTPEEVKKYCASFKFCNGCKFNGDCRAPAKYEDFNIWHEEQCKKILKHIEESK